MRLSELQLCFLRERFPLNEWISQPLSRIPARRTLPTSSAPPTPPPYEGETAKKERILLTLTRPASSALLPYFRPLTPEPINFFSWHCGHNAPNIIRNAILSATSSILIHIFNLSSKNIIQALVFKSSQSVPISIHYHHMPKEALQELSPTNIQLVPFQGSKRVLLHKKTLLIDHRLVITGTGNFTDISLQSDVNLMVQIHNDDLCSLMERHQAGCVSVGQQTVCYCPMNRKGCGNEGQILKEIRKAKSSIQIGMYILTQKNVLAALHEAATERAVLVTIIIDPEAKRQTFQLLKSLKSKISVREGTCSALMHNKVCIIDHETVILGSANWSRRGLNTNQEDLLIIKPLTESQKEVLATWWNFLCDQSIVLTEEGAEKCLIKRADEDFLEPS